METEGSMTPKMVGGKSRASGGWVQKCNTRLKTPQSLRWPNGHASTCDSLIAPESLEPRHALAGDGPLRIGMNLENIVDWSPAWTFKDVFQASRPWIAQAFQPASWGFQWDVGATHPLAVSADGVVLQLDRWTENGQPVEQMAGTLMFRGLGGRYPGGTYHAAWAGTGRVTFGFDARVVAEESGPAGGGFAVLDVTPTDAGIYLRIEETDPADPVRDIHVWMPEWEGQSFVGQAWSPAAGFSPFHPLFLERLEPFGVIRFMGMQETNTTDIVSWDDRRAVTAVRQGSGPEGSASEPLVNGASLEWMIQLANDLDADPWFNMPHMADDDFVRRFATAVRDQLEPNRRVYVEWSNEIWNFGWGFEASAWVARQAASSEHAGLSHWQIAGREAKRDLDIWTDVFAGQEDRLVRVAAGWAANDWVTNEIMVAMEGSFDAVAIAPYFGPTDDRRDSYTAATTVDTVLADARDGIDEAIAFVARHRDLADRWSGVLGRSIALLAYEGGQHLDARSAPVQEVFYAAANAAEMGDLYRDYLARLEAAGLELYVDFNFTGAAGPTPWGDFAKLHRMDEPLSSTARLAVVTEAARRGDRPVPMETEGNVFLGRDRAGWLYADQTPLLFETERLTESFRGLWRIVGAETLHEQNRVFARHASGGLHVWLADQSWALFGADRVGNADSRHLPPAARGALVGSSTPDPALPFQETAVTGGETIDSGVLKLAAASRAFREPLTRPHHGKEIMVMDAIQMEEALRVCEEAARAGGRVLEDWRGRFAVSEKGPRDLVTEADLAAQQVIRARLLEAFPEHAFIGEEGEQGPVESGSLTWMVDPLDGTSNYVHGFPSYAVSIGLAHGDDLLVAAIYDPQREECFTASRGQGARLNGLPLRSAQTAALADALVAVSFPPQVTAASPAVADFLAVLPHVHAVRRTGSTAINLAWLAAGRLDAFWVRKIACWDVAAGLLIAAEAGCTILPCGKAAGAAAPERVSLAQPAFIAAATAGLAVDLARTLG